MAHADPITTLFSTGVDASGNPLANGTVDSHYTVNGGNAYVIGNPASVGWVGNTGTSTWISPALDTFAIGGPYTYHTTFDLTGFDPGTAVITGQMAADDQAVIYLNGTMVFTGALDATAPWTYLQSFSITSGFIAGMNSLDIVVPNDVETGVNDGPTGVQLALSGTASAVPEPATLSLIGMGLALTALARRRRTV